MAVHFTDPISDPHQQNMNMRFMVINDKYCEANMQNIESNSKGKNKIIFILQKC